MGWPKPLAKKGRGALDAIIGEQKRNLETARLAEVGASASLGEAHERLQLPRCDGCAALRGSRLPPELQIERLQHLRSPPMMLVCPCIVRPLPRHILGSPSPTEAKDDHGKSGAAATAHGHRCLPTAFSLGHGP